MRWFVAMSHPIVNSPAAIPDYAVTAPPHPVPPYEEVIVDQQWARYPPDPYQVINNIRARVDSAMGHPDLFGNPEVLRIMQGIQSEWSSWRCPGGGVGVHETRVFSRFFSRFFL